MPDAPSENLPFDLKLLDETEERHRELEASAPVSFGVGGAGPAFRNLPDLVAKRLMRIGLSEDEARRAAMSANEGATSFAITSEAAGGLSPEAAVGLERVLGRNDMIGIAYLETGSLKARSVGRIAVKSSPMRRQGFGTGFMVAPGLLLTNNHVLTDAAAAKFSQVEFGYQEGPRGKLLVPAVFDLKPNKLFVTDQRLDFTLVAVGGKSEDDDPLADFGWCPLSGEPGEILNGEFVNIIQHPGGEPKQLAARENQVTGFAEGVFVHYKTDTAPGSSGSPVFNDQWEVVALHHSGVPKRNAKGKILTVDGQLWRREMGEHRIKWVANEGIRVGAILESEKVSDDLRRRLEEAPEPPAGASPSPSPSPSESASPSPSESASPSSSESAPPAPSGAVLRAVPATGGPEPTGSVTVTIPLQVTVRLDPARVASAVVQEPDPESDR